MKHGQIYIFTLALLFMLSLCGISPEIGKDKNALFNEIEKRTHQGTGGALISISSDNVSAAGYDFVSSVMTVRFRNGAQYEYYGVGLELWEKFLLAQPDPWREVGYPRLVLGGVPYRRIR